MSASCCPFYISRPIIDFYYLSKEKVLQLIAISTVSGSLLLRVPAEFNSHSSAMPGTAAAIAANLTQLCMGSKDKCKMHKEHNDIAYL